MNIALDVFPEAIEYFLGEKGPAEIDSDDEEDEDEDSEWLSRAASTSCSESLRGRGSWVVGSKTVQKGAMIDLLCAGKSDGNTCSGEPETQAAV